MFALNREFITNHASIGAALAGEILADRRYFLTNETALASFHNASTLLPLDAWKELDAVTTRVMRDDEGEVYMADLRALARPVNIGTLVHLRRVSSDAGQVTRSLSGQVAVPMDKVVYDFMGTPIPIFDSAYGREWREWNTLQNANFDALIDDQEAHTAAVKQDMAQYALTGDSRSTLRGYTGYGIMNHPNSVAINLGNATGGANIDLTTATADTIDAFFTGYLGQVLDDNKLGPRKVNLYISPEIGRAWDISYSGSAGMKEGTLWDHIAKNRRVNKIAVTNELSGNEFFGFVPDPQFIRPLIGMPVSTIAMNRANPRDNYQFMVSGAMGLDIGADYAGRSGVFHSVVIDA
jgi:hypothetical protein